MMTRKEVLATFEKMIACKNEVCIEKPCDRCEHFVLGSEWEKAINSAITLLKEMED